MPPRGSPRPPGPRLSSPDQHTLGPPNAIDPQRFQGYWVPPPMMPAQMPYVPAPPSPAWNPGPGYPPLVPEWGSMRPPAYGPAPLFQGSPPCPPSGPMQTHPNGSPPYPPPVPVRTPPSGSPQYTPLTSPPDSQHFQFGSVQPHMHSPMSSQSSLALPGSPDYQGRNNVRDWSSHPSKAIEFVTPFIRAEFPKLEGVFISSIAACLLQSRPLGCAPLPLRRAAPGLHPGLKAAIQGNPQHRAPVSLDKAWVQVLADDLQRDKDKAARSNLREYVSQTLAAIKQVYVMGTSMTDLMEALHNPWLPNFQRPGSCEVVEGALLRLIQQPSLGEPVQETAIPQRPAEPPHAGTCPLPEVLRVLRQAVLKWLEGDGLWKQQEGALQDLRDLFADKAGISISPDIDFGLHQLSSAAEQARPTHAINGTAENLRSSRNVILRSIAIRNSTSEPVMLAHACLMPPRPHTFTLLDDHGVALDLLERGQAVKVVPGAIYELTLALDTSDGPWREAESGMMQALVLLTFVGPSNTRSTPQFHRSTQECSCCTVIPDAEHALFTTGRLVTVCLARDSGNVESLLRVEARPFIAASLREIFNQAPTKFHSVELLLAQLFNTRLFSKPLKMLPAYWQAGRGLRSRQEAAKLAAKVAAAGKGTPDHAEKGPPIGPTPQSRSMQQLHRLLLLEESAMEADICRHDMFNVRLQYALVRKDRPCTIQGRPVAEAATGSAQRLSSAYYTGPSLQNILPRPASHDSERDKQPEALRHILAVLEIPGLPEGRPALVFGDAVYLRLASNPAEEAAAAIVAMRSTQAFLALPPSFLQLLTAATEQQQSQLVHVRFSFDRTPLRRMHAALEHADHPEFQLLPDDESAAWTSELPSLAAVDECAASIQEKASRQLNTEQRVAVASVLLQAGGPVPYALFGPPGTGKTVTLVECALQILDRHPEAKLLLCAPQNYSADLLASALCQAGVTAPQMLRLNDPRRPPNQVKGDVLPFCYLDEGLGAFTLPPAEEILAKRAVVLTCGAAGLLREGFALFGTMPLITFTHVLMDEAGQALLPEALVPLTLLRHEPGCRVLLCGDPKQLGPVVRSPEAATAGGGGDGLSVSLLERFIHRNQAQAGGLISRGLAPATGMLLQNYRSHASLLAIPNRLFYGDQLQAAADQQMLRPPHWETLRPAQQDNSLANIEEGAEESAGAEANGGAPPDHPEAAENGNLEQPEDGGEAEEEGEYEDDEEGALQEDNLPSTLFYGVHGQQVREGEAPSYFNAVEATVLVELVQGLLASTPKAGGRGVEPNDLGVMATYRKQAQKVRQLLRERGLGTVRVGTVDDYQGQEERIIFISTVLSKPESLPPQAPAQGEANQHVGFWRNPKRFNVAITRAQALLVVIGHPVVLMEDANWRELLRFCFARGAYRGAGAALLRNLTRGAEADNGSLFGVAEEQDGEDEGEIAKAVEAIAELALLGAGDIDKLFPESLDEVYAAYGADEVEWRVVL